MIFPLEINLLDDELNALSICLVNIATMERWIPNGTLLKVDAGAEYVTVIEIDLAEVTESILACLNAPPTKMDALILMGSRVRSGILASTPRMNTFVITKNSEMERFTLVAIAAFSRPIGATCRSRFPLRRR